MKYCFTSAYNADPLNFSSVNRHNREPKSEDYYLNNIIDIVCKEHGITELQLKSASRKREISDARFKAVALIKMFVPKITLKRLAVKFNRDHSTIIYSINQFNDLMDTDRVFNKATTRILSALDERFAVDEAA